MSGNLGRNKNKPFQKKNDVYRPFKKIFLSLKINGQEQRVQLSWYLMIVALLKFYCFPVLHYILVL